MKFYKALNSDESPNFRAEKSLPFKNTLKLDSTAYFPNGKKKANYYLVTANFPLYYVQEFDSINPNSYAQGFRMMSNYLVRGAPMNQSIWDNSENTKYGYWEYVENGKRIKHEMWASMCQQKFEWYPSGQLKSATHYGQSNKELKHSYYLQNGAIKEEFHVQSATRNSFIKSYAYSAKGIVILITTYHSINGISKQKLQKRELFYPTGKLKMEENYVGTYTITYYNEDGTKRIN